MMFNAEQKAALAAKLDGSVVKTRDQAGRKLSYIEGWHAIAEANRIFGFDGWNRETVETTCVWSGERQTRSGAMPAASYTARVRITVGTIVREGTGAGSGFGKDHGEAHESAIKEAETDAMKRALMTFGNPFGLALYDKEQHEVERNGNGHAPAQVAPVPAQAKAPPDLKALAEKIIKGINAAPHIDGLDSMMDVTMAERQSLPAVTQAHISRVYMAKREALAGRP